MKRLSILFPILLLALSSCSDSTDGASSVAGWRIPGVGTQFMFVNSYSNGITGNDTLLVTVQQTGQNNGGQSGVVVIYQDDYNGSIGISDYTVQHNGDLWMSDQVNNNFEVTNWDPYPTGSHDTLTESTTDSSSVPGYKVLTTDSNYYVDSEDISTPAGSFSTIRVESRIIQKLLDSYNRLSAITIDTADYWFAPSAGYYVKAMVRGTDNYTSTLVKYSPQ
jgi:hypothetical protein